MERDESMPRRKSIRLKGFSYDTPGVYFLTVCTQPRQNYFWQNVGAAIGRPQDVVLSSYGRIVEESIRRISAVYPSVFVDRYVILPDHFHLLLVIRSDEYGRPMAAPTVDNIINKMKGYVSKKIGKSIWQKGYVDHIIRNRRDYEEHVKYIEENPLRWQNKHAE